MTTRGDIVERLIYGDLRNYDDTVELCREAAAEIEQLREKLRAVLLYVAELRALERKP